MGTYHRHTMTLLSMSDMLAQPTMEGIQAIIMLRHYYFSRQRRTEYTVLITMCLRMAENMGIHRLGTARGDKARWLKASQGSLPASPAQDESTRDKAKSRVNSLSASDQGSGVAQHNTAMSSQRADLHGWFLPKGEHKDKWDELNTSRWHDGDHYMRELGRRVWYSLVFVDWQTAALHDGVYHARESMWVDAPICS